MTRRRILVLAVYVALVLIAAVGTAPEIIRGEDGLEILALSLLGAPFSFLFMLVLAMPAQMLISYHAANWASLIALLLSCGCNALLIVIFGKRAQKAEPANGQ